MALVDYLLLTPLDEEWRTVRGVLCPVNDNVKEKWAGSITYYLWKQAVNRPPQALGNYLVAAASMSLKTPGQAHASVISTHAVGRWKPERVVLLGIAGSLEPSRLQLGDVVISYEIYGYEVGDATDNGINFRPTVNQIGAADLDRVRAFRDDPKDYQGWQKECMEAASKLELDLSSRPPQLHLEVTASGNHVVKSVAEGQKLRDKINNKISAVEMEARGVHQALYLGAQRADTLMIRGISDYADEKKAELEETTKDAWRTFAAGNAARLLMALWRRGPVQPISPSYQLDLTLGSHKRFRQKGVPSIELKEADAQHIAFPSLFDRGQATPELYLEVTAHSESKALVSDLRGQCIIHSPELRAIDGSVLTNGAIAFQIPGSEWGLRAELLLSFPASAATVSEVKVSCRDEFQRSYQAAVATIPPLYPALGSETGSDHRTAIKRHQQILDVIRRESAERNQAVDDITEALLANDRSLPTGPMKLIQNVVLLGKASRDRQQKAQKFRRVVISLLEQIFDSTLGFKMAYADILDTFEANGFPRGSISNEQVSQVYVRIVHKLKAGELRNLAYKEGLHDYIQEKLKEIRLSRQDWALNHR